MMFAGGYLIPDFFCCFINISPKLSGPSLPINIMTASTYSAALDSDGTIPIDSPVVVNADTVS